MAVVGGNHQWGVVLHIRQVNIRPPRMVKGKAYYLRIYFRDSMVLHFEEVLNDLSVISHGSEVNWSSLKGVECVQLGPILHE